MDDAMKADIAQAALRVAEYVHDGNFEGVIVSGGSHQLSHALLALGWGVRYPGDPMPKTFVLDEEANALLYKSTLPDELGVFKPNAAAFREWIGEHAPGMEAMKEKRLVLVDDFILSGVKYREMKEFFPKYHGFENVSFVFFAAKDKREAEGEAFVGVESGDIITELMRLGQHIQGKENMEELVNQIRPAAQEIRAQALGELRELGREMKR